MTDDEIRAVVRQVLTARDAPPPAPPPGQHVSHVRLKMVVPTEPGSPCVIEPDVGCNRCGYCVCTGY